MEKHRDLLMVENERLRQEMRRCEAELQELRAGTDWKAEFSLRGKGKPRVDKPLLSLTLQETLI